MAKKTSSTFVVDLLPAGTIIEIVKFNGKTGEFVGIKTMEYGEWKSMEKQKGFIYRAYQQKFSQFHLK